MISNDEGWDNTARHYAHPSRRVIIAGAATASIAMGMPSGATAQSQQSVIGTAAVSVPVNLTVNGTGHALTLDPRNAEILIDAARNYAMLRQFPVALKLYDRALDIVPNDPYLTETKARIYQAQGNLKEAAKMLVEVNAQTRSTCALVTKITQLRLERNYTEAVRLLQARQAQFHFASEIEKALNQLLLAWCQRDAGDAASTKVTAEQARNALEPLYKEDNSVLAENLALLYAVLGNKESALKLSEHAIMLAPSSKDHTYEPNGEENLALIQMMVGENSSAISHLTHLLQTPYNSWLYGPAAITPALLRLDPVWDPLRADSAFQKLCEEKQP